MRAEDTPQTSQEFCAIHLYMPREDQNPGDSSPAAVQCPQGKPSFRGVRTGTRRLEPDDLQRGVPPRASVQRLRRWLTQALSLTEPLTRPHSAFDQLTPGHSETPP